MENIKLRCYVILLFVLLISLFGCITNIETKDNERRNYPKSKDEYLNKYDTIRFSGTIIKILAPPSSWSGTVPSFQGVIYKLDSIIEGNILDKEILIFHLITPTVYCEKSVPSLTKKIFKIGAKLEITANNEYYNDFIVDDNAYSIRIL